MNGKIVEINCSSAALIPVKLLTPIQGKLKSRTREQLHKLRNSILKHGFSFPIFIWKDGETNFTLDGHGRDFVCGELIDEGWMFLQKDGSLNDCVPCDFIDAKDRVDAKEKLLALNSEYGKITDEGLLDFIFELGFELKVENLSDTILIPELNFDEVSLPIEERISESKELDEHKFIFSQEQIKEAIKDHFPSLRSVEEIIQGVIDIPLAMYQFNKLCSGNKNTGGSISLLFNPHRLETRINNRKNSVAEQFINKDSSMINSMSQWMSKQADVVHHRQYIDVAKANTGTQMAHEFKPYLARDIYLHYCKSNPKVLDPCAGWGGRMIGFASSLLGGEYWATDPATKTYEGLSRLKEFLLLADCIKSTNIFLHNLPFEDFPVEENYFDFAFTSPPYFDTEIYSDEETQAYNRYKTLEEFNEKFLTVLIEKTMISLKDGSCFLLNIGGSQIRFDKIVNNICDSLNLKVREIFDYKIGRGDHFIQKFKGDVLENTVKANDLFFEIRK